METPRRLDYDTLPWICIEVNADGIILLSNNGKFTIIVVQAEP